MLQDNGSLKTSTIVRKMTLKQSWGVTAGTYYPIASTGAKSILAFSVNAIGNAYIWNTGDVHPNSHDTYNCDITTMQIGVPVGIDYKTGCDATLDKSDRVSFTAGMGMNPDFTPPISAWQQAPPS